MRASRRPARWSGRRLTSYLLLLTALGLGLSGVMLFLKPQGRFRHLFKGDGSKALLEEIQADVDADWQKVLDRCGETWEA